MFHVIDNSQFVCVKKLNICPGHTEFLYVSLFAFFSNSCRSPDYWLVKVHKTPTRLITKVNYLTNKINVQGQETEPSHSVQFPLGTTEEVNFD